MSDLKTMVTREVKRHGIAVPVSLSLMDSVPGDRHFLGGIVYDNLHSKDYTLCVQVGALISVLNDEEISAVIAHELGHFQLGHIPLWKIRLIDQAAMVLGNRVINRLFSFNNVLKCSRLRKRELDSDRYSMKMNRSNSMASSLIKTYAVQLCCLVEEYQEYFGVSFKQFESIFDYVNAYQHILKCLISDRALFLKACEDLRNWIGGSHRFFESYPTAEQRINAMGLTWHEVTKLVAGTEPKMKSPAELFSGLPSYPIVIKLSCCVSF